MELYCLVTLTDLKMRRAGLSASAELLVIISKASYTVVKI